MRNSTLRRLLFFSISSFLFLQACVKDDPASLLPPPIANQSFVEEFDTIGMAYNRGWRFINVSQTNGIPGWFQGGAGFNAFSSRATNAGYIWSDYRSVATGAGIISNWAISPALTMQSGDKIIFYTRTAIDAFGGTDYGNAMQVRLNTHNTGTNVGSGEDPGDFDNLRLYINPNLIENTGVEPDAYPATWTRFEAEVGGLSGPTSGRFAFRYFVRGGGPAGLANLVAIDSVAYVGRK